MSSNIYDFSKYVRERAERIAAAAVARAVENLDQPGSVIELKRLLGEWIARRIEVRKTVGQR